MIEPELKNYLEQIQKDTHLLATHQGSTLRHMINGVLGGFGSVVGFALAIVVIGWILNIVGIIPAFRQEAQKWQQLLEQTQQRTVPLKK